MDHHGTTSVRPVYGSRMRDNRRTGSAYSIQQMAPGCISGCPAASSHHPEAL